MKTSLLSFAAAALLFTSTATFAAGPPADRRPNKEFNYGYPKNHQVSAKEQARYEAEQRKLAEQRKMNERRDDRNCGYPPSHKVTPQERARWEAAQRNTRR